MVSDCSANLFQRPLLSVKEFVTSLNVASHCVFARIKLLFNAKSLTASPKLSLRLSLECYDMGLEAQFSIDIDIWF